MRTLWRIAQGPIRVKLRGLEDESRMVIWRELCADPIELEVERFSEGKFVTIPEIGAWNAGYLSVR